MPDPLREARVLPILLALAALSAPRLDVHGDPLPKGAVARIGSIRYRVGEARVWALSPDGKTFAVARDEDVVLWDVDTGRPMRSVRLPQLNTPLALAFAPDGKTLVYRGTKEFHVLDPAVERVRWSREVGEFGPAVAFLPGGDEFFLFEKESDGLHVYGPAAGPPGRRPLDEPADRLSPDGRWLLRVRVEERIEGPSDVHVTLLDPATGRVRGRVSDPRLSGVAEPQYPPDRHEWAVAPDGRRLYLLNPAGRLVTFDTQSGRPREDLDPPAGWIPLADERADLALAPGGGVAYLSAAGAPVRRRDLAAGRWLDPLPALPYGSLVPHPDGKQLLHIGTDGLLRRIDFATRRELAPPPGFDTAAVPVPSPDGRRVAFPSWRAGRLAVYDLAGPLVWSAAGPATERVAWSSDGRRLACLAPAELTVRDAVTGKPVWRAAVPAGGTRFGGRAGFGPGGATLFADVEFGERPLCGNGNPPGPLRRAARFDLARDRPAAEWTATEYDLHHWAPAAGDSPAAGFRLSWDGDRAVLHDPRSGLALGSFTAGRSAGNGYVFSPNGLWLAVADGDTVSLWDVPTGRKLVTWTTPDTITSIAFAGSGKLVTGQTDLTALVWDLKPRKKPTRPAWDAIAGDDPVEAARGVWALAADPSAPALLRKHIPPAAGTPNAHRWIAELDAGRYVVRERAVRELSLLGRPAAGAMREALARSPSAAVRTRLQKVLDGLTSYRQDMEITHARAVLALELAGTPAAKAVLTEWAAGDPGATLTADAKAALGRLGR